MLPFAIQFSHAFENHKYSICHEQNKTHFDTHKVDCSVFHYKLNNNAVAFYPSSFSSSFTLIEEENFTIGEQFYSINLQYKSSRAPPYFIV